MLTNLTLSDNFGRLYRLLTPRDTRPHTALQAERFFSETQALRFLRQLTVPHGFWHHIQQRAALEFNPVSNENQLLKQLSQMLYRGRIQVYHVDEVNSPATRSMAFTDESKTRYAIKPVSHLLIKREKEILHFSDEQEARTFIEESGLDEKQLNELIQENKLPRGKSVTHTVAAALVSGELVVTVDRFSHAPPLPTDSTDASALHIDKYVPLGPERPDCTFDIMTVHCSHYSEGRKYKLDVLKDKPTLNGIDKAIQVIAKPGDPDVITVDYAGNCCCGNKDCPSIIIDSSTINGTFTDKPYKFEVLPGSASGKPDGFMDFLKKFAMPEISELDYAIYNIGKGGCNGSENINAKVLVFPTFKWEGSAGFGYSSKDVKQSTSGTAEKKVVWDARLKINGNHSTSDWELAYEAGSEKPIFPKLQSYLQGFFEQINKFCSTSKKSSDKPIDIESHVDIGGGVELKENSDDFGVDLVGSFGVNLNPLIKASITYDVLDGIINTISGGIVPFLKKIRAEAKKAKQAAEAIQKGAKKAKEVRDVIKKGIEGENSRLHGDIAIDLKISGTAGTVLKWQKDLGKPWKTTSGDVVNEATARIELTLTGKAEAEADIFFVKASIGAMFIVADTKDSSKGIGVELKITATTEKEKPALSGNVTVTGAAIYYAYWAELGVKASDSDKLKQNKKKQPAGRLKKSKSSSTVKKNVKDITKWTEIFKGWTWPKDNKISDDVSSKPSSTSIENIND